MPSPAAPRPGGRLSGWCMDGYCLPSVVTKGCPGTFKTCGPCECECHTSQPSERAVKMARQANLNAAMAARAKDD